MNNSPAVSIIVPVYKAEAYLHRCVDSLLSQTFTDFEILLIDDGSPDGSGMFCDKYAKKDSRIKVFHKENGGVASARQCGLDNATGEYIIHADPDDWVEITMLEALYMKAKEDDADMVICDFFIENNKGTHYRAQKLNSLNADVILRQLLSHQLHGSCCNKLVRKSCFVKYDVCFNPDIIRWEDLYINCELLRHDIKVTYIPNAFYHYDCIINESSLVRNPSPKGVISGIIFCNYFSKELGKEYKRELDISKMRVKRQVFRSNLFKDDDFKYLFYEINPYFKNISIFSQLKKYDISNFCVRIANKGHYKTARSIFIGYSKLVSSLVRFKHLIMNNLF